MLDIYLIKDQNRWIAQVLLEDGKNAPLTLSREFSDEEARQLNQADQDTRKQVLLPLLGRSVSMDDEISSYLPLASVTPRAAQLAECKLRR